MEAVLQDFQTCCETCENGIIIDNDQDNDGVCDDNEVLGCTNVVACNFNANATEDDGSCDCIGGCTNPSAANYDSSACFDDGSCFFIVFGCVDPVALNYDPTATVENGLCCYIGGCTDPLYLEYNPLACFDDGSCDQRILYIIIPYAMTNYTL